MIAKAEWFGRRKYTGWGVTPKTWQGWLYIIVLILILVMFQSLSIWTETQKVYITIGWIVFLFFDIFPVMINIKKDEREFKIEAVSERNAAWMMSFVLAIGIVYQTFMSGLAGTFGVDYFLIGALIAGTIVKSISNYVLEKKGE